LRPLPLVKLPVGAVKPAGWLQHQMELMSEGFSGRLPELSTFCQYDGNAWTDSTGHGRFGWEELPYWLKGYIDLGYVLQDKRIIADSTRWVEAVLKTQRADGYFGSTSNLTGSNTLEELKKLDLWPNMVMLYVLRTHYEATQDKRIIEFMLRYYQWFMKLPLEAILPASWQKWRGGDNLDHIYWLYNHTGEAWLLEAARINHERTADWVGSIPTWHGVNVSQCFREPAQYFQQTRDERYLRSTERVYDTIFRLYGQVPGGGFASDENARPGFNGPRQGTETCTWVEFLFSHEMLASITGDAKWADRAEDIAFNSLPASMTPDLKGLHYLTAPNQVQLDRANKAPLIENGGDMFSYNPYGYRCCQHNAAMGWPYYAERLWMATQNNGLAAMLYAKNKVTAKVAQGSSVTIEELTDYPFGETVHFRMELSAPATFPLALRIPEWCKQPRLRLNGAPLTAAAPKQGWLTIQRQWKDADQLELTLPMRLEQKRWPTQRNAATVQYGPLTLSLRIGEDWKPYGDSTQWQKYEVFPKTPWNYALEPDAPMAIVHKSGPVPAQPFTADTVPILVTTKARRVPGWTLEPNGMIGEIQQSPIKTDSPAETITLIPMGAARLRLSMFPVAGGARTWDPNPPRILASRQTHENPAGSPGFDWDGARGSTEWIEYRYQEPRALTWAQMRWAPGGEPKSARLLAWNGAQWVPLRATGLDRQSFQITTTALRLEVELEQRGGVSLLEWSVGGPND
jgi:hypothetical protein